MEVNFTITAVAFVQCAFVLKLNFKRHKIHLLVSPLHYVLLSSISLDHVWEATFLGACLKQLQIATALHILE